MNKLKRILWAIDFGESTNLAIDKVALFARCFDAEVIPMHAVEIAEFYHNSPVIDMENVYQRNVSHVAKLKAELLAKALKVREPVIVDGRASMAILKVARERSVDLIVLGAGQKNIFTRMLGTTAEKVIRKASQPVLAVHPSDSINRIKTILCALDCTRASDITLRTAITMCREFDASLTIIHVVPTSEYRSGQNEPREEVSERRNESASERASKPGERSTNTEEEQNRQLSDFLKGFNLTGIRHSYTVEKGIPADKIHEFARNSNCDLLVMGAIERKEGALFFVKGTIEKLLRRISCSIMTVKHVNIGREESKAVAYATTL